MMLSCQNPFAPAIDYNAGSSNTTLGDLKSIDGIFQNLQTAYTTKDTLIYGKLLSEDFSFSFRDYDQGFDVTWGRVEEMRITSSLFQNSDRLNLIWNNDILRSVADDSLSAQCVRAFNLVIVFNPSDVARVDGRVNLQFTRSSRAVGWKITHWIDESNY